MQHKQTLWLNRKKKLKLVDIKTGVLCAYTHTHTKIIESRAAVHINSKYDKVHTMQFQSVLQVKK